MRGKSINSVLIAITAAVFLLTGCIDLKCDISISDDGSGVFTFDYTTSWWGAVYDWENGRTYNPLPDTTDDFELLVGETGGLTIIDGPFYSENENGSNIKSSVRFDRIATLDRFLKALNESYGIELSSGVDADRLTISFSPAAGDFDPESTRILEELFPDNYIEITIETPGEILSVNGGTADDEGRMVFRESISDFIGKSINMEVVW